LTQEGGQLIDLDAAKRIVNAYLTELNYPGGLAIALVKEYPCGWMFYWNSAEYVRTQDGNHAIAGNVPVLVDRSDGALYSLGPIRQRYDPERFPVGKEQLRRLR
jgi:hypothetical protein